MAEIEGLFRRDVKLRQLDTALNASSFATPTELKDFRALTEQQREVVLVHGVGGEVRAEATCRTMPRSRRTTRRTRPST